MVAGKEEPIETNLDATECQGLEQLPLDDDSLAEFHDAGTWSSSDDDDDDIINSGVI